MGVMRKFACRCAVNRQVGEEKEEQVEGGRKGFVWGEGVEARGVKRVK